jgi:Flp pilus assembly protein TadD
MSLIVDALKKTQQLRLNGSEGSPISGYSSPGRTRVRSSKKQWIVIGTGLMCLCILLLVFLRPASSPLATQTNGVVVPLETKRSIAVPKKEEPTEGFHYVGAALTGRPSSVPVAGKTSSEPPQEASSLPKDEAPLVANQAPKSVSGRTSSRQANTQGLPHVEPVFSKPPCHPVGKKESSATKSSHNEKGEGSRAEEAPKEEKIVPSNRSVEAKNIPPFPPVTQKEEASPKSIALEQDGEKGHPLALDILTHFNSGVAFYNQKEFSKAIQAYHKVIELDPTYVEAYNNLGIIYQTLGDVKSALGAYQKSAEINPRYEKGYNNLGLLFLLEGRYEEALEVFRKALAINANNIESHINLGILFKKKGQAEKAIESYQRGLAIDPLHKETHYNMALLYEQLEDWELAINHYQQFVQLASKSYPELVLRVQRHLNALAETKRDKKP